MDYETAFESCKIALVGLATSLVALKLYPWILLIFSEFGISSLHSWVEGPLHRVNVVKSNIRKVTQDFQRGVYYKPVGRQEPTVIRSPEAIKELCETPQLSQRAVYADIFGFQYTIGHENKGWDPNEQTKLHARLSGRAIKTKGLAQIGALYPYLQKRLDDVTSQRLDTQLKSDGWNAVQITPFMRYSLTGLLGVYFFGNTLCNERDFGSAMFQYYNDIMACAGILPVVPDVLKKSAYNFMTKGGRALDTLISRLVKATRPEKESWPEEDGLKSVTLFHNMVEASKSSNQWTPIAIAQDLVAIWFAASHQPWINLHFVFLELCARPEYVRLIREEIDDMERNQGLDHETICKLPLFDSFIKESVRLNPLDKMAIRRKALQPYTFHSTGQQVAKGRIACVPAYEFMHDPVQYPEPDTFDGHRFMKVDESNSSNLPEEPMRGTTFVDSSKEFPIWGLGSRACPGRWHASLVIKMTLVKLIRDYDFRLADDNQRVKWFWETFQMPYENTRVLMKKRSKSHPSK